jgi:hypothetical protein
MAASSALSQIAPEEFINKFRQNIGSNIRYVSPRGNDAHDGLSWATAKETVMAAYDSIVERGTEGEIYGVIYIAHRSKIHQDPKQGIWIMGRGDPFWQSHNLTTHYDEFPNNGDLGSYRYRGKTFPEIAGWRKAKHVLFKGVGGERAPYAYPVAAQLGAATGVTFVYDENYPAIWISGASEIAFEDLIIRNRKVGINLGVARRGINHTGNDDASYCLFHNVSIDVVYLSMNVSQEDRTRIIESIRGDHPELANVPSGSAQWNPYLARHIQERVGPCVHCEKGLKIRFEKCVFITSYYEQLANNDHSMFLDNERRYSVYSDNRAGILAKTPSLISVSDCFFKCGNFKYYDRGHAFGFDIRDCIFEGNWITNPLDPDGPHIPSPAGPLVHIIGANNGSAFIENIGAGDISTEADVKVDGSEQVAGAVVCINVATVKGPATILNIPATARWQNIPWTLARQRQVGFWQGRVSAQHDSARRSFSPVAARFKNMINPDPSTWPTDPNVEPYLQLHFPAPDGTLGAFRLLPRLPSRPIGIPVANERRRILMLDVNNAQSASVSRIFVNEGDVVVAGVWVRAAGDHGFAPWEAQLLAAEFHPESRYKFDNNLYVIAANAPLKGDGEWEWISVAGRVKEVTTQITNDGSKQPVPTTLWVYLGCARGRDRDGEFDYSHDFYAPMLLHIPGYDISNNEIHELRQHMSTWPDNVEPGTVSLLKGQDFSLQSHIISKGMSPSVHPDYNITVNGNEISGQITIGTNSRINDGEIAALYFRRTFKSAPQILLTPANRYASTINTYVGSSVDKFTITATNITELTDNAIWNYYIIE